MKASLEKKLILECTPEEAAWLREQMQNPIGVLPENESEKDAEMRKKFFDATEIK